MRGPLAGRAIGLPGTPPTLLRNTESWTRVHVAVSISPLRHPRSTVTHRGVDSPPNCTTCKLKNELSGSMALRCLSIRFGLSTVRQACPGLVLRKASDTNDVNRSVLIKSAPDGSMLVTIFGELCETASSFGAHALTVSSPIANVNERTRCLISEFQLEKFRPLLLLRESTRPTILRRNDTISCSLRVTIGLVMAGIVLPGLGVLDPMIGLRPYRFTQLQIEIDAC